MGPDLAVIPPDPAALTAHCMIRGFVVQARQLNIYASCMDCSCELQLSPRLTQMYVQTDRILTLPAVRAKAKQLGIELPDATPTTKATECTQEQLAFGNRAPRYTSGKPCVLLCRLLLPHHQCLKAWLQL